MAGVLLGPGPLTKSVAAPYDATATYGVGDHCSKDGKIYICVSAITTAEAWTAAHWERVMVEEEIEDTKKGLAYVEEGTTASQNIAAGSYVWWQGQMCVAASAIAVGDTLSTTNLTIKSTGGLNDLNSKIEVETLLSSSTHNAFVANQYVSNVSSKIYMQQARAYKIGHVVMMTLYFQAESALADGDALFTFAVSPLYGMSLGLFNGDHRIYQSKGIQFGASGTFTIKLNANIDADSWLRTSVVYFTNS